MLTIDDANYNQISFKRNGLGFNCSYQFTTLHTHTFWEFVFVVKPFRHLINGKISIVQKNTALIIKPQDKHSIAALDTDKSDEFTHLNIKVTPTALKEICDALDKSLFARLCGETVPQCFDFDDSQSARINSYIKRLLINSGNENITCAILRFIIIDILEKFYSKIFKYEQSASTHYPAEIAQLISDLNQPANFSRSIDDLLKSTNYSHSHTIRIFKQYTGKTIQVFFDEIKMRYAQSLLINTDLTIATVAEQVGYISQSNFARAFKSVFSCAPNTFRKQNV